MSESYTPVILAEATMSDLVDEIGRRSSAALVMTVSDSRKGESLVKVEYRGGFIPAVGLATVAHQMLFDERDRSDEDA